MNVRDYITAAILYVLMFLVYAGVGAPIGMTVAGSLFVFAACAVVWGTIFMLLFTKVNKKGIVLLFGLIWAAMQLMSFWGVALVIAVGAVIAELFWRTLDRHKFSTMLLCFTVQVVFLYLGMTIPLIFMKDMYLAAVCSVILSISGRSPNTRLHAPQRKCRPNMRQSCRMLRRYGCCRL